MKKRFKKQVESINAASAHFALRGYHVNVTLSKKMVDCTIFFDTIDEREDITKGLLCFADEGDEIYFNELKIAAGPFYTLRLTKEVVL